MRLIAFVIFCMVCNQAHAAYCEPGKPINPSERSEQAKAGFVTCLNKSMVTYDDNSTSPYEIARMVTYSWCLNEISEWNDAMDEDLATQCNIRKTSSKTKGLEKFQTKIIDFVASQVLEHRRNK